MAGRALLNVLGDVDIRLLRIFVTVCECNGIAASELELNIGKSTISKHISDLEQRIGLKLCNRGPSGFSVTSEGSSVLELTYELLERIDDFQSRVDDIHRTLTGTVRLGIFDQSSTNSNACLHDAIRRFDGEAPDVGINVSLDTPAALESAITDGTLDLAIVPLYRPSSALRYSSLYKENMTLYCGSGHVLFEVDTESMVPKPDLTQYKYAGYSFNSPNLRAGNRLGLKRSAKVREEEALCLLVQSGCYVGFLADHVAETFASEEKVWPILPKESAYNVTFAAITRKKPEPDRKTQTFLKCLIDAHGAGSPGKAT
ncbi:MAG: LysR family transcriptional regulator [Pseudomonadota bacterium]